MRSSSLDLEIEFQREIRDKMKPEVQQMEEKKYVEKELSQLMEFTLHLEDELNSIVKN